jgi:membrane protease YdiL (CAAX protease family)
LPAFALSSTARTSRSLQFALFLVSLVWWFISYLIAGRAAHGLALRFDVPSLEYLLSALFLLFLMLLGFSVLQGMTGKSIAVGDVLGLPKRATSRQEWSVGAAIGWGIVALAVLPMALAGKLHPHFWFLPRAWVLLCVNLATLAAASLAEEAAFRGYPFRRLIEATGPATATILFSIFFGLLHMMNPEATWASTLTTILAGVVLSVAWLRTHGLWLGWGLHFAWNASMGVLFGLPVSGLRHFSSVVDTTATGPVWLTGGFYGPEGSGVAILVILIGLIVLVRFTRDYAWDYTRAPLIAAGYAVDVAPPAAHTAMEQEQPKAPSLVQILPTTPQTRSVEGYSSEGRE